jgi:hypothetical protein
MMQYFSQMLKLPLEAFVFSMEMLVKTMQGIQKIAYKGIDMMTDGALEVIVDGPGSESAVPVGTHANPEGIRAIPEGAHAVPDGGSGGRTEATQLTIQEEERRMPDRNLHDDMLKLVRYKILFVKRDYEHAFPEKEELVSENTDESGYTAWKIAEFIQDLKNIDIPPKWRDKPKPYPPRDEIGSPPVEDHTKINHLPEDDKKYLRVYYEVLERYPRERFRYEERQIEVLEEIAKKIR